MKFTPALSSRLLLMLGVAVPVIFPSLIVKTTSLATETLVELSSLKSTASFAHNLDEKLKVLVGEKNSSNEIAQCYTESYTESISYTESCTPPPGSGS